MDTHKRVSEPHAKSNHFLLKTATDDYEMTYRINKQNFSVIQTIRKFIF